PPYPADMMNQIFSPMEIPRDSIRSDYALDGMKEIAARQSDVNINWQLHAGGAMVILSKIKAAWPNTGLDLLSGWDPSWPAVAAEGWAEPVTLEKVPNLADIPQKLLVKDNAGNIINIPHSNLWFLAISKGHDTIPDNQGRRPFGSSTKRKDLLAGTLPGF
ncbi:hypothetical protein NKH95_32990, partial [Mesorhizobium sp. M0848]